MRGLEIAKLDDYRSLLSGCPEEWQILDGLCRATVSEFYRDPSIFQNLTELVLPTLVAALQRRAQTRVRCLSAGCASGEEAYTLKILWEIELSSCFPDLELQVDAIDTDQKLIERAHRGCYKAGSLKALPAAWRRVAFVNQEDRYCVAPKFRQGIKFYKSDIRDSLSSGPFDLVLCRNLAFTYFDWSLQREILLRIAVHMEAGGALVLGKRESLPEDTVEFAHWPETRSIYRRTYLNN